MGSLLKTKVERVSANLESERGTWLMVPPLLTKQEQESILKL